jgi:hypothetical protein
MSLARHGLYMRVAARLAALGVKYTLPPYQVLYTDVRFALRPAVSPETMDLRVSLHLAVHVLA